MTAFQHFRTERSAEQKNSVEVDRHDLVPIFSAMGRRRLAPNDAGIVHEDKGTLIFDRFSVSATARLA